MGLGAWPARTWGPSAAAPWVRSPALTPCALDGAAALTREDRARWVPWDCFHPAHTGARWQGPQAFLGPSCRAGLERVCAGIQVTGWPAPHPTTPHCTPLHPTASHCTPPHLHPLKCLPQKDFYKPGRSGSPPSLPHPNPSGSPALPLCPHPPLSPCSTPQRRARTAAATASACA